jgi:TPR repeat protein
MAAEGRALDLKWLAARWRVRTCVTMVFLVLASGWLTGAHAETRVALVIGNGSYTSSRLKNPRSDAGLMAKTLASTGFEVITVMDATADQMRQAVADFGSRLQTPGAVALFYYAGHGVQIDGDNYLIPLGAEIGSTQDATEHGVPLQSVMRTMARSGTRLNIVVLDACRDNPFVAGGWTASVTGLASVVAPADTIIAYATGPGQMADDGAGSNSPYTSALTSEIIQPGATLEEVFRATRRHVLERTGNQQTPWEHSSLISQFFFVPKPAATTETSSITVIEDARFAELAAWDRIKGTHDPAVLRDHIKRFPNGLFAELADVRIAKTEAMRSMTPWSWIMTAGNDGGEARAAAEKTYDKAVALDGDGASDSDLAVAVRLYTEAAAQGLPSAMYRLGRAFDKGRGVSRDLLAAARWYERASVSNHPQAMAALGTMHEFGEGAAPNLAEALRLYRGAADAGDASGTTSLGYLYAEGKGVAQNLAEARRLYAVAAAKNNARAMFNLALLDLQGRGARINIGAARKHFEAAAGLGHSGAMLELAHLYDRGTGVRRDPTKAGGLVLKGLQAARKEGRHVDAARLGWTFATRRQIQKQLAVQGLYAGMLHGIFNEETRRALVAVAQR